VRLADVLVKAGLITPAHLRAAQGHGHVSNKRLATYLVDNGVLTTDQMAVALDYVAMPAPVVKLIEGQWKNIKDASGRPIY